MKFGLQQPLVVGVFNTTLTKTAWETITSPIVENMTSETDVLDILIEFFVSICFLFNFHNSSSER